MRWLKYARRHGFGEEHASVEGLRQAWYGEHHGGRHGHRHHEHHEHHEHHDDWQAGPGPGSWGGPDFGMRRPLRFLAHALELEEAQFAEVARIFEDLKTERAQAEVDHRRIVASFADALNGEQFDTARADEGANLRLESAARIRDAELNALKRLHAVLDESQRRTLSQLIRSGRLVL
jgi:Spy/CpxP family protein refolding chaperone